jgi:hypothetical protein
LFSIHEVKEVSNTLGKSAEHLPVPQKQEIEKQLTEVENKLSQAQQEILSNEEHKENSTR